MKLQKDSGLEKFNATTVLNLHVHLSVLFQLLKNIPLALSYMILMSVWAVRYVSGFVPILPLNLTSLIIFQKSTLPCARGVEAVPVTVQAVRQKFGILQTVRFLRK